MILAKQINRESNSQQQPKQYFEHHDDNNIIKLDEFFRNDLSILVIGLIVSLLMFITERIC